MIESREARSFILLALLVLATMGYAQQGVTPNGATADQYHALPQAWAGDWDNIDPADTESSSMTQYKAQPPFDQADPMIKADLTPWAAAKMEATSYDDAPGSLCDPEGWFPFINYGYGFALLVSPGGITFVPVEPDTEGIRRAYFKPQHAEKLTPSWDGDSIAHWEGDTLILDTIGYNDKSWLGDDREPHSTELHMVERLRLIGDGQYLEIKYEISDPKALKAPYHLTRYFHKYVASHIGGGPELNSPELVCNEDPSPFRQRDKKTAPH
jgi:hypothetical protein